MSRVRWALEAGTWIQSHRAGCKARRPVWQRLRSCRNRDAIGPRRLSRSDGLQCREIPYVAFGLPHILPSFTAQSAFGARLAHGSQTSSRCCSHLMGRMKPRSRIGVESTRRLVEPGHARVMRQGAGISFSAVVEVGCARPEGLGRMRPEGSGLRSRLRVPEPFRGSTARFFARLDTSSVWSTCV